MRGVHSHPCTIPCTHHSCRSPGFLLRAADAYIHLDTRHSGVCESNWLYSNTLREGVDKFVGSFPVSYTIHARHMNEQACAPGNQTPRPREKTSTRCPLANRGGRTVSERSTPLRNALFSSCCRRRELRLLGLFPLLRRPLWASCFFFIPPPVLDVDFLLSSR